MARYRRMVRHDLQLLGRGEIVRHCHYPALVYTVTGGYGDPEPFDCMWWQQKKADLRDLSDRPEVRVGDQIMFREFDRRTEEYSGRKLFVSITHIQRGYILPTPDLLIIEPAKPPYDPHEGKQRSGVDGAMISFMVRANLNPGEDRKF